jgi:hypothetical protein
VNFVAPGTEIQNSLGHSYNQGVIKTARVDDALRVYVDIPLPVVVFCQAALLSFRQIRKTVSKSLDRDEFQNELKESRLEREIEQRARNRQHRRIARIAARQLRIRRSNGQKRYDALRELSAVHSIEFAYLTHIVVNHNRCAKDRYDRLRERAVLHLANQGKTNIEIGKRFGVSAAYAGRIVRDAFSKQQQQTMKVKS